MQQVGPSKLKPRIRDAVMGRQAAEGRRVGEVLLPFIMRSSVVHHIQCDELCHPTPVARVLKKSFEDMGVRGLPPCFCAWIGCVPGIMLEDSAEGDGAIVACPIIVSDKVSLQDMMAMITKGGGFGGKDSSICHFVNLCDLDWS